MDCNSGRIYDLQKEKLPADRLSDFIEMDRPPTGKQLIRRKVGRNDLCPCNSGKKFKHCHYKKGTT